MLAGRSGQGCPREPAITSEAARVTEQTSSGRLLDLLAEVTAFVTTEVGGFPSNWSVQSPAVSLSKTP